MNHSKYLLIVRERMVEQSPRALANFTAVYPAYNGANWDDVLDMLWDSDHELDKIEPIYRELEPLVSDFEKPFVALITITLVWAGPYASPTWTEVFDWITHMTSERLFEPEFK